MIDAQEADDLLIRRVHAGEDGAFDLLVQRYRTRVHRLALRFMHNREEAEEVSQEVFLTVYRKLAQFEGKSSFSTWLYRVAVNASLMRLRAQENAETVPIDDLAGELAGDEDEAVKPPDYRLCSEEALAKIERAMDNLPEEFKTILILRDIEDFSNEETAEIMDLTVAAVKSRLHRARSYLRKKLEDLYRERRGQ